MSALHVRGLTVSVGALTLVSDVKLDLVAGEVVAIVGESGAGKSMIARALMGMAPTSAAVHTREFTVHETDVRGFDDRAWRQLRGGVVGLVTQDALSALDPLQRVGSEVAEPLRLHGRTPGAKERRERVLRLLRDVGIPDAERRAAEYPHQLSGGLRQRALIAAAIAAGPSVLIADEPTTALDATVQVRILHLLREIADAGTAVLLITHDLAVVRRVADRVLVMRESRIVEQGLVADVLSHPKDEYTRTLLAASTNTLRHISDEGEVILRAEHLNKSFRYPAVNDATFTIAEGTTLGIVGESGSGKTTLARMLIGAESPDSGSVTWTGSQRLQFVHQNPLASLDPRWTVGRSIAEALQVAGVARGQRARRLTELLAEVDLSPELGSRYPGQLSGGQRQRVVLARALAAHPTVLVLDEPVSALDASVRRRILDLLRRLQENRDLTMVVVSHDLGVIGEVADTVLVMREGWIVEQGTTAEVFADPQHPFTHDLLASA